MHIVKNKLAAIETLRRFPEQMATKVKGLTPAQLTEVTPVDIWTVAQVIHHCADSHMNAFIRLKLVLTEENPPLKNYDQDAWAVMVDETHADIEMSLSILRGVHARWTMLFDTLVADETVWEKVGQHSEDGPMNVTHLLFGYQEHCEVHLAQVDRIMAALG